MKFLIILFAFFTWPLKADISIGQPPASAVVPALVSSQIANTVIMRSFTTVSIDFNTNISHATYPAASISGDVLSLLIANGDGFWHVTSLAGFTGLKATFFHSSIASRNF